MRGTNFEYAAAFTMAQEGGGRLVTDSGGLTKYGISQRAYPEMDIAALSEKEARALYYQDYWLALGLERFPLPIGLVMFDAAVNLGRSRATKLLQRAVNMLSPATRLKMDGDLGPKTRGAIRSLSGTPEEQLLLAWQSLGARLKAYYLLAARPRFAPYLRGWAGRCAALGQELGRLARWTAD